MILSLRHRAQSLVIIAATVAASMSAAAGQPPGGFVLYDDGRKDVAAGGQKMVGAPVEVRRKPVFDNAPFLQLKPGDKLVRGRMWFPASKESAHFAAQESLFLFSSGKYYDLSYFGPLGRRLKLLDADRCMLFDWEVSLATAGRLRRRLYEKVCGNA